MIRKKENHYNAAVTAGNVEAIVIKEKEMVLRKLKEQGCRITKQRKLLLDVILKEDCTSCKEIYYKAASIDPEIGAATVYRMVNLLEEIGVISRKNMYCISCSINCDKENACIIKK